MKIVVKQAAIDPDRAVFDVAERKGIGHPDSLADLVADAFSHRYIRWCQNNIGTIPNHWVDKVNLVGAASEVTFGGFEILKPVDCYLFGKVTAQVGMTEVPVYDLFADAVSAVLPAALGDERVLEHMRLHVNNSSGVAVDHDPQFYRPKTLAGLAHVLKRESVANDTVICVGASRPGLAGTLAMRLESAVTGEGFRATFPSIGTDVKVMVVRDGSELDITACIPFHPEATGSFAHYQTALVEVRDAMSVLVQDLLAADQRGHQVTVWDLHLNTKDVPGHGYLAPFGTSLGKGDCGAVGRGNRFSGVIEPLRPSSCEAPSGKNPLHHAGKIYSSLTADAASEIMRRTGVFAEVTVAARNGAPLDDPAYVLVSLDRRANGDAASAVEDCIRTTMATAGQFAQRFLDTDLIGRFREGGQ
ncbi:S-adenosylmethionine synthetase [Rhizocola hellebori]|uniref:S-adenosylmethionine synthetase n=1 Tax=Rhizocola hellebori TaxID=1392758 RepID=A0A8J3Q4M5_9ACTN|nr:methionine adenosyltransferase [Rhizocola hellebori]GIH03248.1 S-adenosylmethionine synthetase [Rhizocola hellebori]